MENTFGVLEWTGKILEFILGKTLGTVYNGCINILVTNGVFCVCFGNATGSTDIA